MFLDFMAVERNFKM